MDRRINENLSMRENDYVAPFLWMHGNEQSLILKEIERIYDCGIRSICLESRTHEDFVREGWWSDVDLIFDECAKRNMKVWILDEKHFPTGTANGIFKDKYKDLRPFGITEKHVDILGPVKDGSIMVDSWKFTQDDEVLGVIACKHIPNDTRLTGETIDVSSRIKDGMCYFDLPEGMWRMVVIIKTRAGYADYVSHYMDVLNPHAVDLFIEEVYEPHYKRYAKYFGNVFRGFFSDEPGFKNDTLNGQEHGYSLDTGIPFSHQPYKDGIIEILSQRLGEDARKLLPGLWFDFDNDVSDKIRYEYLNYITMEYKKNFCDRIGDWCRAHNVEYIGHIIEDNNAHYKTNYAAGHFFRALEGQDMSGIDVVLHQILPGLTECNNAGYVSYGHMNSKFFNYYLAKLGSSLAHIDPKKKGRVMCEVFGAFGWAEGSKLMKYLTDHMLVRGVNYYVPHAFSPMPNNPDCPPNFSDAGENPEFKYFDKIISNLNRASHILSDGVHVPSCAILYDAESHWVNREQLNLEDIAKNLYDDMLDYDVLPTDYLSKMTIDGCINGEKYPLLIIPYAESMPIYVIEKIKKTPIKAVVCAVNKSDKIDGFKTVLLKDIAKYVSKNGFRDVTNYSNCKFLRYYHYQRNGADFYMFHNEDMSGCANATIKLSAFDGGDYIEYEPFTNKAVKKHSDKGVIKLRLEPYHSVIIAVNDVDFEGINGYEEVIIESQNTLDLEFNISLKRPTESDFTFVKKTNKLYNITGIDGNPYFSGDTLYVGEFDLEEKGNYLLDLGKVGEIANVKVNDIDLGAVIVPPYVFDISSAIKEGKNKLEIITSSHNGYVKRDEFSKYLLFEASGLLGPITLKKYNK